MLCLNIHDGTVLWRQPVDNLDALAPDVQKEAKALRREELRLSQAARALIYRLDKVIRNEGDKVLVTDQAAYDRILTEARTLGVLSEKSLPQFLANGNPDNYPIIVTPMQGHHSRHPATTEAQTKRQQDAAKLDQNDWFRHEGWYYPKSCYTGRTFPAPVSDGVHVWAFTQDGTAACFALDGKRMWVVDSMAIGNSNSSLVVASPTLIGKALIVFHNEMAVALDKATGKELWRHATGVRATYSEACTPVHLVVDGTDYVYLTAGQFLRLADGKQVGSLRPPENFKDYRGYFGSHFDAIGRNDRLWLVNKTNGGGGQRATPFR